MGGFAWVTLATNDSYSLGALVLAHSLKRVNTAHQLAIMITPGVSEAMRTQLSAVFNVVKLVDVLDSKDQENLALLARPELGITFTKLHCWKFTEFDKCVFLDADTIVLQNSDELFEREELSAAPDVGWPDCFNSGVFVFKPSEKTFKDLIDFALVHGTFDGGDQGLLNLFFSDWATKDISKHLPFVYNVVSSTVYTYLPAFKQFKDKLKIIHFIGSSKPWLQPFDTETGIARISGDVQSQSTFIQLWWDLFCAHVHPTLTSNMSRQRLSTWYVFTTSTTSTDPPSNSNPFYFSSSSFPKDNPNETGFWSLPPPQTSKMEDRFQFVDPWEDTYEKTDENNYLINEKSSYQFKNDNFFEYNLNYNTQLDQDSHFEEESNYNSISNKISSQQMCERLDLFKYPERQHNFTNENYIHNNINNNNYHSNENQADRHDTHVNERPDNVAYQLQKNEETRSYNETRSHNHEREERNKRSQQIHQVPTHSQNSIPVNHPIPNQKHFPPDSTSFVTNEEDNTTSITNEEEVGLAAALSTIKLGVPVSEEQTALHEHLRRQGWEEGNIDYMGRDSFDNIWKKISETLASGPSAAVSAAPPPEAQPEVNQTVPSAPPPAETTQRQPETPLPIPEKKSETPSLPVSEPPKIELESKLSEVPPTELSTLPLAGSSPTEQPKSTSTIPPGEPTSLEKEKPIEGAQVPLSPETKSEPIPPSPKTEVKSDLPLEQKSVVEEIPVLLEPQKPESESLATTTIPTGPTEPKALPPQSSPITPVSEPNTVPLPPPASTPILEVKEESLQSPSTPASEVKDVPPQLSPLASAPKPEVVPIQPPPSAPISETKPIESPLVSPPTPTSTETAHSAKTQPSPHKPQVTSGPASPPEIPPAKPTEIPTQQSVQSSPLPSVTEPTQQTITEKADLTPPPSPSQPLIPDSKPVVPPTPSTPTVTSPTPPTSPAAVSQDPLTIASKLKVESEVPSTPPVPQSVAQPPLPGATGDEPPVPPKRKGGKGGGGGGSATAAASHSEKQQQPKGGKGGKGKK